MAQSQEHFGNFDLVKRVKLDFTDVSVSKWRSRITGLTVVHLDYEAPIVNGYFVIPTEIFDDSGCPHTLEHLVFMGSEKYPYKGILDLLANRGFSNGTNAWTDTDHTAYTISTAGEQGFLQLLPIYVDHILYPTITNAGMQRLMDPPGSAYRSETGGLMEALRVLTAKQIRDYHSTYYVPHNLHLIVAGKFSSGTSALLQVVQDKVEPTLIEHGQNKGPRPSGWKRPFVETPSANRQPIAKQVQKVVEFPEQDESMGELALDILSTYLTSSAVAPLNKEFVEIESPLCSYIYFSEDVRTTRTDLPIYVGSVPTEHLDGFPEKLRTSLKRIADEGIDMERMKITINRDERQLRSKLESAKGETFSSTIINDALYGAEDGSELHRSMDEIKYYEQLKQWSNAQWADLIRKYYVDPPTIVVVGKPSASLAEKIEKDEIARTDAQVKALGPEGLKKAEAELEAAKAEHERPIPDGILNSFPVPDVKSISWIPVETVQEPGSGRQRADFVSESSKLKRYIDSDGQALPFFVEYDQVESDFVTIHAYASLAELPDDLRPYVLAYLSSFFSLPVKRESGERLNHEEVINKLESETVSYDASLGIGGAFTDLFRVSIRVETALYDTAVSWLKDLLYHSEFDKDRLAVVLAKIQQSLPESKRDGSTVLNSLWTNLIYSEKSTSRAGGVLSLVESIPLLVKKLQENPAEVVQEFEQIRSFITKPNGFRFSVTGNVLAVDKPRSTWKKYFALPSVPLSPVPHASETLSELGKQLSRKATVMSLPTIESSFATHTTKGIQGFNDPKYPAARLAQEVLNATESYLWRYIRGSGLAYGAYVSLDQEAGLLSFSLFRSSNSVAAFEEAKKVIKGLVDGSIELDVHTLDAAKSTIVYGVAKGVSTAGRAAIASFANQALKGLPQRYQVDLLEKYQAVTKEDVLAALRDYFLPLFDPASSIAVVVTAPSKVEAISKSLLAEGFDVTQKALEVDPSELEEGSEEGESDSEDESESDASR
ncbi:hypothetical protein H1R20_g8241, partial [Candolleomyces eurysporus]